MLQDGLSEPKPCNLPQAVPHGAPSSMGSAGFFLLRQDAVHDFHSMNQRPRPPRDLPTQPIDPEGWDKDPGRPLALRLLALLGAVSFLALGISSLLPILQRQGPIPEHNGTKTQPLT